MFVQTVLVLAAGALVAFVNGANDVSKGIATLVGSGVSETRRAIRWGTWWTALGGPKMVALVLGASALSAGPRLHPGIAFAIVTAGMVAGSLAGGRRVTQVLAEKITRMDHREGFVANLVTSALVAAGALGGLPMSTTHVSSTGIKAAGADRGGGALNGRTIRDMVFAWVVTLPLAAALGVGSYLALRLLS